MHMDDITKAMLERILRDAVEHADDAVEEDCPHSAATWMDVAREADHILRHNEQHQSAR